jgi:Uma2 family endonuclease
MTVMRAEIELPSRPGGWTVADLDAIPDDPGFRYELEDGTLVVSPPPEGRHDYAAFEIASLLRPLLPSEWAVTAPGSVELNVHNWRHPDVIVVRRECLRERRWPHPEDALLAVEVMSSTSVGRDRVAKPAQYAAAGIPHYWRYEPTESTGPVLVTHELADGVYRETGRFDDVVTVTAPVEVTFRLAELLP